MHVTDDRSGAIILGVIGGDVSVFRIQGEVGGGVAGCPSSVP